MKRIPKTSFHLLFALLTAITPLLTACSDDDAPTMPEIKTGEIPAENLYVTIDGTFIYGREGKAELSGTIDPTVAEQHLQLVCEPMFITYRSRNGIQTESPVFDVVIKQENGATTIAGRYEGNGHVINLTGEVSVNYKGESDWRLDFVQEETYIGTMNKGNSMSGKTFEFDLTDECVYAQPLYYGIKPEDVNSRFNNMKRMFSKMLEAFRTTSGFDRIKIVFVDDYNYELWFRNAQGEYVKDEFEHKYIFHYDYLCLIDEAAANKKLAGLTDLSSIGIGYRCGDGLFSDSKKKIDPNSSKEYCLTYIRTQGPFKDGTLYMFFNDEDHPYFSLWNPLGSGYGPNDDDLKLVQMYETRTGDYMAAGLTINASEVK